jgi:phage terminase large subunit
MGVAGNVAQLETTPVFEWNYTARKRYVINQGGSSSGKTIGILQVLNLIAAGAPGLVITVTAETLPALRKGAIRDFEGIIATTPFSYFVSGVNKSTNTYIFTNGSVMEFVAFSSELTAKHGKRDYLFLNEANNISQDIARQLIMRTRKQVFIDFNPDADFWVHDMYMADPEAVWFYSTYRDNSFAPVEIVREIEALKKTSPEHYRVYGLGLRGSLSGQVFSGVNWIPTLPKYFEDWVYCMDIGFANSYTTLAKVGRANGMMYGDELLYERGMNDKDIATRLTDLGVGRSDKIVIDSANAMLIDYLNEEHGFEAVPCKKRNVSGELSAMRAYTWNITDTSTNWKKEAKNYVYQKAKGGGLDNTPVKAYDHLWDAARYGFLELVNVNELPQFM